MEAMHVADWKATYLYVYVRSLYLYVNLVKCKCALPCCTFTFTFTSLPLPLPLRLHHLNSTCNKSYTRSDCLITLVLHRNFGNDHKQNMQQQGPPNQPTDQVIEGWVNLGQLHLAQLNLGKVDLVQVNLCQVSTVL